MTWRGDFFDPQDALDYEGDKLCPVCLSSLKQIPKYVPSVFAQAEMILNGEALPEERMGWICPNGCTKAQMK
jgi:hypothetical protein